MKYPDFFSDAHAQTSSVNFFHPIFRPFLGNTLGNKKLKFSCFWNFLCVTQNKNLVFSEEKKTIVDLNSPKHLSFVGELHRFRI